MPYVDSGVVRIKTCSISWPEVIKGTTNHSFGFLLARAGYFCVFQVYIALCFLVLGCQSQSASPLSNSFKTLKTESKITI